MGINRNGQSIIEVTVAIGILVVGFLGGIRVLTESFGINRTIEDNHLGAFLAAEGMEVARSLMDYNFYSPDPLEFFNANLPDGCYRMAYDTTLENPADPLTYPQLISCDAKQAPVLLFDPATQRYNYVTGNPTNFRRMVRITETLDPTSGLPYRVAVSSTVTWVTRGDLTFDITLEGYIYRRD